MYVDFVTADSVVTDAQAINNSIRNILTTRRGSIPGKPRFGSDVYKVVFEIIDPMTEDMLKQFIFSALKEYEPRIFINYVQIKSIPEYNKVIANINYSYRDSGVLQNAQTAVNLSAN